MRNRRTLIDRNGSQNLTPPPAMGKDVLDLSGVRGQTQGEAVQFIEREPRRDMRQLCRSERAGAGAGVCGVC